MKIEEIKRVYVDMKEINQLVASYIERELDRPEGSIDPEKLGLGRMTSEGFTLQWVEIDGKVA